MSAPAPAHTDGCHRASRARALHALPEQSLTLCLEHELGLSLMRQVEQGHSILHTPQAIAECGQDRSYFLIESILTWVILWPAC